jgi:sugar lactone lactonase YvrE
MTTFTATLASASAVTNERHVLAEGPLWVAATERVMWVDIERGLVFEGRLDGDRVVQTARQAFAGTVGAVVRAQDGSLLVAGQRELFIVAPDGTRSLGPRVVPAGAASRTNDGACDPAGRFLVGTVSTADAGSAEAGGTQSLYRVEDDATLTTIDSDLALSNGLAFSPDGTLLYSIDTEPGTVWVRDYDAASGATGIRREHLRITDGHPDGMCADSRGHLWIAIWGAGEVRCFDQSGEHVDTVSVAAPHVSSVAFVGPALDRLLITTASRDLSPTELLTYPDAGRLFLADVGTTGTVCSPWSGSWISAPYSR